jgi:hypothetical protein
MTSREADIVQRLREVGCDREPFTHDHAKCICRLANKAGDEIERLRTKLANVEELASAPRVDSPNGYMLRLMSIRSELGVRLESAADPVPVQTEK